MRTYFYPADIMLPDFLTTDGTKWATIACDQYTSEPEYWDKVRAIVGEEPSTVNIMLPEIYLSETDKRLPDIYRTMEDYASGVLQEHKNTMIYLERTQSDGRVRHGIVGCIDLEDYDYAKGATKLVRATEGTVVERIPPRVKIRRGALLETPHIMILIDDPKNTVIAPFKDAKNKLKPAYDFELMQNAGRVSGRYIGEDGIKAVNDALAGLCKPSLLKAKYGDDVKSPLLFAVGDGNHSLATAKASYEEIKEKLGAEAAASHPARYALCEIVNIHDDALTFEPIYRVLFEVDPQDVIESLKNYADRLDGTNHGQSVDYIYSDGSGRIGLENAGQQLTVGTLQNFIDAYLSMHENAKVDYIHGEDSLRSLAQKDNAVGFLFDGMGKDELFKTVIYDGSLPRKTFSMGHADDKRFYIECRKIR